METQHKFFSFVQKLYLTIKDKHVFFLHQRVPDGDLKRAVIVVKRDCICNFFLNTHVIVNSQSLFKTPLFVKKKKLIFVVKILSKNIHFLSRSLLYCCISFYLLIFFELNNIFDLFLSIIIILYNMLQIYPCLLQVHYMSFQSLKINFIDFLRLFFVFSILL